MKNNLLFIIVFLIGFVANAQLAVTDPTNTSVNKQNALLNKASLAKETKILVEAEKTALEAKKQVEFLKKAKESLEKVSGILKDINDVEEIISLQNHIIINSKNNIKRLKVGNVFSVSEMANIMRSFTNIVVNSDKSLDLLNKLLTNDLFKMSDADRLKFIKETKADMQEHAADMRIINRHFLSIANNRLIRNNKRR